MNRVAHATPVIAALVLASLCPASAAMAKAHPHRHRPLAAERRGHAARRASRGARRRTRAHKPRHPARHAVTHTHMAGDPAVSIIDFNFAPVTTTIHVGDTITWTNTGKQPHSATADNHSFDTGILHTGQSRSHTFTSAGTFAYFCVVHPFMKGTIVVLASTTTTTTTTSTRATPTTTSTTPPAHTASTTPTPTNGQTLPFTGTNDLAAFAIGLLLVGGGFGLRARVR